MTRSLASGLWVSPAKPGGNSLEAKVRLNKGLAGARRAWHTVRQQI